MKGKIISLLVLSSILLIVPIQNQAVLQGYEHETDNHRPINPQTSIKGITGYVEHDPIEILNDSAFGPSGYNFLGTGTSGDPYQITGYNITNSSRPLIHIENTTKYFRVSNSYFNGLGSSYNGSNLVNVSHGTFENNAVQNCTTGFYLDSSIDNNLSENMIYDCIVGLSLDSSNSTFIFQNTFYDCLKACIDLQSSTDNMITWNNFFVGYKALIFNGHKYIYLYDDGKYWSEAKTACEALGGHLITITDQNEYDFVINLLYDHDPINGGAIWLGLTDESMEGTFEWVTGEDVKFDDWGSGQPNGGAIGDYVLMWTGWSPGTWNDIDNQATQINPSGVRYPYICEWDTIDYVTETGIGNNTYEYNYWDGWNSPDDNSDGIVDIPYRINNNGLYFDGENDYADLTDFVVSDSFTIELWVNPFATTAKGGMCIIGKHTTGGGNLLLLFFNSSALWYIDDSAWYYLGEIYSGWQHLTLIIERNTTHTIYQCFKNGNLLNIGTRAGIVGNYAGKPWTLGQDWDSTSSTTNFYYGMIDEIRVLNGTLTATKIREDCSSPTTHYPVRANTVAWYHLNETSGTLIKDYSGNGNDGTTINGAKWSDELVALDLFPRATPIWIDSNDDFLKFSSSGTGTSIDPYIIENQHVMSNQTTVIQIQNTDAYFEIRNSIFDGLNGSNTLIDWNNVTNGKILISTIRKTAKSFIGIYLRGGSSYNTISGNTIHDCGTGIAVYGSNNNTVTENQIYNLLAFYGRGIIVNSGSSSNMISNNNITGNWNYQNQVFGITVMASSSSQNTISGNTITDVGFYGIQIAYDTHHNTFSGNNISNVGMYGIRANLNAHNNTYSNNYILKGSIGLLLDNSSDNLVIGNIISDSSADGISISTTSNNNFLSRNTISDASDDGISLSSSSNNTLLLNVLTDCNSYGVNLIYSNKCIITRNNFVNNNPLGTAQAYDNGSENNVSYNYWSTHTTPDSDGNGYVDAPYYLDPYYIANQDLYSRTTPIPTLIIISPLAGTHMSNLVKVSLDGVAPLYLYYIAGIDAQNQTWTASTDRTIADGTYTLHAYGSDADGTITHDSVVFTIDTTPPIVTITSPTNTTYSENSVTLTYSVSDGTFTLYIDNGIDTTASGSVVSALNDGVHNITIVAVDAVGNVAKKTVIFTVDTTLTTTTTTTGTMTTSILPSDTSKATTTTTSKPGSFPEMIFVLSFFTILVVFVRKIKRT